MTFKELKELLFWTLDNGQNIDDLAFLNGGNDGKLINQALRDLADCLHIVKYNTTLAPDSSGLVNLPGDLRDVLLVKWGDYTKLTPIDNVLQAALGSGEVTQYMLTSRTNMQLYDVPTEPYETLYLWYQAYPAELVNDGDVPADVPEEYQEALATVYARAQFFKKLGDFAQYQQLMGLWAVVKKDIRGVVEARVKPVMYTGEWVW